MLNRKTALLALVIVAASGTLAMLMHANGTAQGPTPPQIAPMDSMLHAAKDLPELKIENLF